MASEEMHSHDAEGEFDPSEGWCCDGRTYKEHAHADGQCCQPQGIEIAALPEEAQKAAREREQKELAKKEKS
jgi:hypothetical protein